MLDYKYDTQLLIDGENLSEDEIHNYIMKNIEGDCLIAVEGAGILRIPRGYI